MHLGGWSRLGIVLSVLYGTLVAFIAHVDRPRLESLQDRWFYEAARAIADAATKDLGREVLPYQVRDSLFKGTNSENVAWLEKVAHSPSEKERLFSQAIRRVNEEHKALISELRHAQFTYWLKAFAWWATGTFLLFGVGWTVRWIYRGFRNNAV